MPDRRILIACCLLLCFASAEAAEQKPTASTAPSASESSEAEDSQSDPETPKTAVYAEIKNGLLSVDFENTDFGAAIKAVADKAGFKIEGSGDVFRRKLNTKFSNVDIERGVTRMLTLVKESNYMLHYDTSGSISKLEILGAGSGSAPAASARQPLRTSPVSTRRTGITTEKVVSPGPQPAPVPSAQPSLVPPTAAPAASRFRRIRPNIQPAPAQRVSPLRSSRPATGAAPQTGSEDSEDASEQSSEESIEEIPYIAPQKR